MGIDLGLPFIFLWHQVDGRGEANFLTLYNWRVRQTYHCHVNRPCGVYITIGCCRRNTQRTATLHHMV